MNDGNKALNNISSRRVFRPFFKARWQNMQNIINDSVFYTSAPEPWLTYYNAYIRQWNEWASGFVPMLHRGDFFSTGIGYTICEILARECMSGGYRVSSKNKILQDFISDYGRFSFMDIFFRMFFFANAGGNCFLKLTPKNGELTAEVLPINRIIFEMGERNEVTHAMLYNRFTTGKGETYYAKETRCNLNGNSFYKVEVCPSAGTATSPSWGNTPLNTLPKAVAPQFKRAYGDIELNHWYTLPKCLHSLGLYNVRNKPVAVAIADMPGYSDSSLHTSLDILYSIDYNYTQQQLDMYWSKTRVLVPKQMQMIQLGNNARNNVVNGVGYEELQAPLDEEIFTQVPDSNSIDGKPMQPTFIQPDMRGEAHKYIRDADLELLASKVGLSSATLANHLAYTQTKTATQVNSEQDTTETTVNSKRELANLAINQMLQDLASFYGFTDEIAIIWNRTSVNSARQNEELLADYQAGLLTIKEYLKRRWRDLSDEEIEKWVIELEATADKKRQNEMNAFGGDMI